MQIPNEIIGVVLAAILTGWWSTLRQINKIDTRLARIEAAIEVRWGIDIKEVHKKKHEN